MEEWRGENVIKSPDEFDPARLFRLENGRMRYGDAFRMQIIIRVPARFNQGGPNLLFAAINIQLDLECDRLFCSVPVLISRLPISRKAGFYRVAEAD